MLKEWSQPGHLLSDGTMEGISVYSFQTTASNLSGQLDDLGPWNISFVAPIASGQA